MDNYLRSRGQEKLKERPLLTVESGQGYIHYRKGSVILYYLKEMIGEEKVNAALRKMIQRYAYAQPPYPTSWDLVDAFRQEIPAEYQYLVKDLFEDITLFSNRTLDATAQKRSDGKFDVTINVESHKFKADPKGNETEVPVDDWIDIGAFAKPEKDRKYGKTLYRERVHITQAHSTYTFVTSRTSRQGRHRPVPAPHRPRSRRQHQKSHPQLRFRHRRRLEPWRLFGAVLYCSLTATPRFRRARLLRRAALFLNPSPRQSPPMLLSSACPATTVIPNTAHFAV